MLPRRDPLHAFFLATEHEEPPLALKLTDRQMSILVGTTVEALPQQEDLRRGGWVMMTEGDGEVGATLVCYVHHSTIVLVELL
eukprot:g14045.t1